MRDDGVEQRRSKRVPRRSAAWIERVDDGTRIPCVVWDISEGGARLAAPRPAALPPAFKLWLTSDNDAGRLCRVVWRNDRQVGVEFVGAWAEDVARDASKPSDACTPAEPVTH